MVELDLTAIGLRVRTLRGNLTQSEFAERLGLDRKTVGRYENGERAPDALALVRLLTEFDASPSWVLVGEGIGPSLSDDEQELLTLFRKASIMGKAASIGALQGIATTSKFNQVFHGSVGASHQGDNLRQKKVRISVGGKTKK